MYLLKIASVATIIPIIVLAFSLSQGNSMYQNDPHEYKKALIIDGLSEDLPNEEFIRSASFKLEEMGYSVDVRKDATISLYETLPSMGYDIIIFRTHSVAYHDVEYDEGNNFLAGIYHVTLKRIQAIFTIEPYDKHNYASEQLTGQLARVTANESNDEYFAITSAFLQDKMKGDFKGATIIMMGCFVFVPDEPDLSTYYEPIPQILIDKGASFVIGWSGSLSIDHSDNATLYLLDNMKNGVNLEDAINSTKEKLGADPEYGGILHYVSNPDRK